MKKAFDDQKTENGKGNPADITGILVDLLPERTVPGGQDRGMAHERAEHGSSRVVDHHADDSNQLQGAAGDPAEGLCLFIHERILLKLKSFLRIHGSEGFVKETGSPCGTSACSFFILSG